MNSNYFWHITTNDKLISILKNGINSSDDGNYGEGIYCIKQNDFNSLRSVIELDSFYDNGYTLNDLIIIEFSYNGEYKTFKPIMKIYNNEEWIIIKQKNIPSSSITNAIPARRLI